MFKFDSNSNKRQVSITSVVNINAAPGAKVTMGPVGVEDINYTKDYSNDMGDTQSKAFFERSNTLTHKKIALIKEALELMDLHYPEDCAKDNIAVRAFRDKCLMNLNNAKTAPAQQKMIDQIENFVQLLRQIPTSISTFPSPQN